jgi:starvation-inducible outer membrane lipoprotein
MIKIYTATLLIALTSLLAGCATTPNVLQIHKVTAEAIGLASTDELTMGPVTKGKEDFLGGAELTFQATTAKGRVFNCSTFMTPGILLDPPKYSRLTCTK